MNGKFFVKTFGCQMNVADSERIAAILCEHGMSAASSAEEATVIIVNGCTVRAKALHKAVSTLGEYNLIKRRRPEVLLGIGGCAGQLERDTIFKRAPYVNFVFGTDSIDDLPELLFRLKNGEQKVFKTGFDESTVYTTSTKRQTRGPQAFVNIMKGCDKHCTYCIVPYTRGPEKSRASAEVLEDVARLVGEGVRELMLLGQNVNSFGRKAGESFTGLLRAIEADPRCSKLRRIRFTSSHPYDFSDELLQCFAPAEQGGVARLAAHLHLPVQ
jgi:tRNA-2-methylthio-N6-dimethylallyladenosine synthase